MAKIANSKDLIMLLLYAKGHSDKACEPIQGRTRLMKIIFLFNEEIRKKFNLDKKIADVALPDFEPYNYGPYSEHVYDDLEFLLETEFINMKRINDTEDSEEEMFEYQHWQTNMTLSDDIKEQAGIDEFSLTDMGKKFVEEELDNLTKEQWDIINKFKARCTGIPLKTLLRYVYAKYPKMTIKSKIKDEISL